MLWLSILWRHSMPHTKIWLEFILLLNSKLWTSQLEALQATAWPPWRGLTPCHAMTWLHNWTVSTPWINKCGCLTPIVWLAPCDLGPRLDLTSPGRVLLVTAWCTLSLHTWWTLYSLTDTMPCLDSTCAQFNSMPWVAPPRGACFPQT